MSQQALAGIDDFVRQVNSKLQEIPRVITVNVSGLTPAATASTGAVSQGTQSGIDAESLAEHLYPHIRDRLDAESRLRGMR